MPQQTEVWKEFESNEISHSVAHHLTAIGELTAEHGYARVSDVARHLDITRGSVSLTLKALRQKNYVLEDENKFLRLSPEGQRIVNQILAKRRIVRTFLHDVLKLDPHRAEVDACKVEHLLSVETGTALLRFLRFLLSNTDKSKTFLEEYWGNGDAPEDLESFEIGADEGLIGRSQPD